MLEREAFATSGLGASDVLSEEMIVLAVFPEPPQKRWSDQRLYASSGSEYVCHSEFELSRSLFALNHAL